MDQQIEPTAEIAVHDLKGLAPDEAYAVTQTNPGIKDGDVLNLGAGNVAVLVEAWPVMVVGRFKGFHGLIEGGWDALDGGKYRESAMRARDVALDVCANRVPPKRLREAVAKFRDANGRGWKEKLNACWMSGNYRGINFSQVALLQQVRNEFGPAWLARVKNVDLD